MSKSYDNNKHVKKNPYSRVRFEWTRDPETQIKESKKGKIKRVKKLRNWEEEIEDDTID